MDSLTPEVILSQYETRPRALSPEFVANIPWSEVSRHPLDPQWIPVLRYMRNIEKLTEVYFEELRRTPTLKEPVVKRFMERWNEEEAQHGDLLNRFLNEAGVPSESDWYQGVRGEISWKYKAQSRVYSALTYLFGHNFSAVHMLWGAINEMTTLQGYKQLGRLSAHPVLQQLLNGIMQEEATHIYFYFNLAQVKLANSSFAQGLSRWILERFWGPVGTGIRPEAETHEITRTLFSGDALRKIDRHVNQKVASLPGFSGFKKVTETIQMLTYSFA